MHPPKSEPPPLHYLRWLSLFLFLLSLGAMFLAGLFYNQMTGPGGLELAEAGGVAGEFPFSVSLAVSIGLAILAGITYVGGALSERLLDLR